jgi:hypothetical protein
MNVQRVKTLSWCALLSLTLSLAGPLPARAAEADRSKDDQLRRKTEEVERLKQELQRAQDQLRQLKADNQRLQKEQARQPGLMLSPEDQVRLMKAQEERSRKEGVPAPPLPPLPWTSSRDAPSPFPPVPALPFPPTPGTPPAKPLTPIATLPQLNAGQLVDLDELVGHFRADPAAAGAHYGKKTFRVKGVVARFDPALMLRNYDVILASPDALLGVVCNFRYPDHFTSVHTKQKGRLLVARAGSKTEHKLLEVGDTAIIQGKCHGLKDGQIILTGCELVK